MLEGGEGERETGEGTALGIEFDLAKGEASRGLMFLRSDSLLAGVMRPRGDGLGDSFFVGGFDPILSLVPVAVMNVILAVDGDDGTGAAAHPLLSPSCPSKREFLCQGKGIKIKRTENVEKGRSGNRLETGTEDWKDEGAVGCFMRVVRGGLRGFWAPEEDEDEDEEDDDDDEEEDEEGSKVEANSFSMSLRVSSSTSLNVILGMVNLFLVAASLIAVTSTIFCKSRMSFCICAASSFNFAFSSYFPSLQS